jgi:hypothetical protein
MSKLDTDTYKHLSDTNQDYRNPLNPSQTLRDLSISLERAQAVYSGIDI